MATVTIKLKNEEEYRTFDLPAGQTEVTKSWLDEQLAQVQVKLQVQLAKAQVFRQTQVAIFFNLVTLASSKNIGKDSD